MKTLAPPCGRSEALERGFKRAFHDFEASQLENHARLNGLAGMAELDERLLEQVRRQEPSIIAALANLAEYTQAGSPSQAKSHLVLVMGSRLASLLREAPFFRQILDQPRGYPGDAEMMRYIYRARFEGETPFGRFWHRLAVRVPTAQAVRNRKELLFRKIRARPGAAVLSLAAGPAEELRAILQRSTAGYTILALDHDLETLRELDDIRDPRFRAALANAFSMIQGEDRIAFPRRLESLRAEPAKDLRGWRRLLAPLRYRFERLPAQGFDLVYSAGLYDYIRPSTETGADKAQALTRCLFDLVAPGGELVVGNFNPTLPGWNRFCMEFLCNWRLVYRSDQEMLGLAAGIAPNEIASLQVVREAEGINSFLVLRKA